MPENPDRKPKFPMKPKTLMRWMVPGPRHHKQRIHLFRQYLHYYFKSIILFQYRGINEAQIEEAKKMADNLISKWMKDGFEAEIDGGYHFYGLRQEVARWRSTIR